MKIATTSHNVCTKFAHRTSVCAKEQQKRPRKAFKKRSDRHPSRFCRTSYIRRLSRVTIMTTERCKMKMKMTMTS
jgi:hypothetical protein